MYMISTNVIILCYPMRSYCSLLLSVLVDTCSVSSGLLCVVNWSTVAEVSVDLVKELENIE